jgi:exosortase
MQTTPNSRFHLSREAIITALCGVILLWIYWPTFGTLFQKWTTDSQYSHGYIVPLFAAYLLWARRKQFPEGSPQPSWWGYAFLLGGLALHLAGTILYFDWFSQVSLLPCLTGLAILAGGWKIFRWSWPALLFLVFMVPLPFRLETALSYPLQRVGTIASTYVLQTLGFVAFSQGNIIHLGEHQIGVVEACNGLSMMMVFFTLSTAMVFLTRLSIVEIVVVIASAIPIALIANITRIIVTAILYNVSSAEAAQVFFHDLAGWLMMVYALGLLWLELRLLGWVLIPTQSKKEEVQEGYSMLGSVVKPAGRKSAPAAERAESDADLSKVS